MPRYFFHVKDGRDVRDEEGSELPNVASAQVIAVRTMGEILRERAVKNPLNEDMALHVLDEAGREVLTLRLSLVLHAEC